jgi:hypothetical protein
MSLLGQAALAMWWDISPQVRSDFEDWHAHEHFPERLGIQGFRRGTRWSDAAGGEGMFVMYEMAGHETLSSPGYVAHLNAPTPWSTRLMPHHRNMVRSQCRVVESRGGGIARHALTLRISPVDRREPELQAFLASLVAELPQRPGLTGAHLLRHQAPNIAATTEQKIRLGADRVADWVFVVCGYDLAVLDELSESVASDAAVTARGAMPGREAGLYTLSFSATPTDVDQDP